MVLSLAKLSALVTKPVLLCAKDRANLCHRPRNATHKSGGVLVLAQATAMENFGFGNVDADLQAIFGV